jgi:peptide-methionine (S)-S-oxide reductase
MEMQKAAFAAGCFWGIELEFQQLPGVVSTAVGYMGGWTKDPTYEAVCTGETGHAETVLVEFDPNKISYPALLRVFWKNHNPTTLNKQGPDIGTQYRSAIFCDSPAQLAAAMDSKEALENAKLYRSPIVTQVIDAQNMMFYKAEDYHQNYFNKQGIRHCNLDNGLND